MWQPCAPANREARGWGGGEGARVGEMGTWERVLGYVIDVGRLSARGWEEWGGRRSVGAGT